MEVAAYLCHHSNLNRVTVFGLIKKCTKRWEEPIPGGLASVFILDRATSDPLSQAPATHHHQVPICTRGTRGALYRK